MMIYALFYYKIRQNTNHSHGDGASRTTRQRVELREREPKRKKKRSSINFELETASLAEHRFWKSSSVSLILGADSRWYRFLVPYNGAGFGRIFMRVITATEQIGRGWRRLPETEALMRQRRLFLVTLAGMQWVWDRRSRCRRRSRAPHHGGGR